MSKIGEITEQMLQIRGTLMNFFSKRTQDWMEFAGKVASHIQTYAISQYGDKGEDQCTEYTIEDCIKQVKKYLDRYGKNQREGQQELDFLKAAHYIQIASTKYEEAKSQSKE